MRKKNNSVIREEYVRRDIKLKFYLLIHIFKKKFSVPGKFQSSFTSYLLNIMIGRGFYLTINKVNISLYFFTSSNMMQKCKHLIIFFNKHFIFHICLLCLCSHPTNKTNVLFQISFYLYFYFKNFLSIIKLLLLIFNYH